MVHIGYMDFAKLASELLRSLRGKRSQPGFSKFLGYQSNVAYRWESGRAYPTAAGFLAAARKRRIDVAAALEKFYVRAPPWLGESASDEAALVAHFLKDLTRHSTKRDLAAACGRSRFVVSRWINGDTEPRLPDFLRLIEVASHRLLDFVSGFVDPNELPSVSVEWTQLEASRNAAYDKPWSQAVLRCLELVEPASADPAWIARALGIREQEARDCIQILLASGQVRREGRRLEATGTQLLDTRRDPERARRVREFWAEVAVERMQGDAAGRYGYNLYTVSKDDLKRIQDLQTQHFEELRALIASSEPAECVVLQNWFLTQLA